MRLELVPRRTKNFLSVRTADRLFGVNITAVLIKHLYETKNVADRISKVCVLKYIDKKQNKKVIMICTRPKKEEEVQCWKDTCMKGK